MVEVREGQDKRWQVAEERLRYRLRSSVDGSFADTGTDGDAAYSWECCLFG